MSYGIWLSMTHSAIVLFQRGFTKSLVQVLIKIVQYFIKIKLKTHFLELPTIILQMHGDISNKNFDFLLSTNIIFLWCRRRLFYNRIELRHLWKEDIKWLLSRLWFWFYHPLLWHFTVHRKTNYNIYSPCFLPFDERPEIRMAFSE